MFPVSSLTSQPISFCHLGAHALVLCLLLFLCVCRFDLFINRSSLYYFRRVSFHFLCRAYPLTLSQCSMNMRLSAFPLIDFLSPGHMTTININVMSRIFPSPSQSLCLSPFSRPIRSKVKTFVYIEYDIPLHKEVTLCV